ncbi:MAG: carbohydrate ABC transporter permease [Acidimicrobiia bacterium]|nr:carbohydrate ABC transporter permease [Acidimicrobiia bacterium]
MTQTVKAQRAPSTNVNKPSTMARESGLAAVVRRLVGYVVLIFFALVFIMPFVLSLATAFKSLPDIQANPVSLVADPQFGGWTLEGVRELNGSRVSLPRWTLNSVVVTVFVVLLRITFGSLAGYALARLRFPGRGWIFALILAVQAIPGIVLAIPRFMVMKELGIINTYAGMIIPLAFDAFAIFLMKQFFEQLPRELEEAAALDGASTWGTFRYVMLPLAAPGLIALTILSTQSAWNEFLHILIARIGRPDLATLPVGLAGLTAAFGQSQPWNTIVAGALITIIPIAIVFFIFQRYFVQGTAASAVKG